MSLYELSLSSAVTHQIFVANSKLTYRLQPFLLQFHDVQVEVGPEALSVEGDPAAQPLKFGQLHVIDERVSVDPRSLASAVQLGNADVLRMCVEMFANSHDVRERLISLHLTSSPVLG